uniref:Uncharacterized protein n=1 Tax=Oryza meridionalis TaxID=40149 RepID=A0A0E0CV01_9ORYZ
MLRILQAPQNKGRITNALSSLEAILGDLYLRKGLINAPPAHISFAFHLLVQCFSDEGILKSPGRAWCGSCLQSWSKSLLTPNYTAYASFHIADAHLRELKTEERI